MQYVLRYFAVSMELLAILYNRTNLTKNCAIQDDTYIAAVLQQLSENGENKNSIPLETDGISFLTRRFNALGHYQTGLLGGGDFLSKPEPADQIQNCSENIGL